jgi:TolB-like protein/DNA-binding winged helix-turn-helix (wHTH) protein
LRERPLRDSGPINGDGIAAGHEAEPLRFAGLVLDLDACTLTRESGEAIALTRGEFALLRVFVTRPGRVLSRDMVLDALGSRRFEPFDRSVDMQVGRLRRKVEPDPREPRLIVTVPGEGYRFDGLTKTRRSDPKLPVTIPVSPNDEQRPRKTVDEAKRPRRSEEIASAAPTNQPRTDDHRPDSPQRTPSSRRSADSFVRFVSFAVNRSPSIRRSRFALMGAGAAAVLVVIAAGAWLFLAAKRPATVASAPVEAARLSMVILPFVNLSGDASQGYVVDALTDALTTSMARFPGSAVITRNTAFTYKDKPIDARTIGKELGVRYVLEGSVQPTGPQVRVNAQFIDAENGAHVWADQFDATRADLLQTQDEIVIRLARAVGLQLAEAEAARLKRKPPANAEAQDLAAQCVAIRIKSGGPFGTKDEPGFPLCEQALAIDPDNVLALHVLSTKYWSPALNGRSADPEGDLKRGEELVDRALSVDPNYAYALHWKAIILASKGLTDEAIAEEELTLSLDPSIVEANLTLGNLVRRLGQFERSLELIDKALRLSPLDPPVSYWYTGKADALFALKRYDEAIEWARRTIVTDPGLPGANGTLAAALALTGRVAEAQEVAQRLASLPSSGLKTIAAWNREKARITHQHPNPRYLELWDRKIEALRKAGLPEGDAK